MLANSRTLKSHVLSGTSLTVLCAIFAPAAWAQDNQSGPVQLGPVSVQDTNARYQNSDVSSPKYTAPLLDVPQTVTVVSKELMQDENLLSLRDVLANTIPGITFTAGEGGSGFGDGINLRGYSATADITIDGARDPAQYSRSDSFDIERIEVTNGADSVYNGGGAIGGGINIVTKTPTGKDFTIIGAGGGTDNYGRLTLDAERSLGDGISLRLNAMLHNNNLPGRDVEKNTRYGLAPSIGFGLNSDTSVILSYFYEHDRNIPEYGVPYFLNAYNNGPLPGVSDSSYYGYSNLDVQRIDSNAATVIVNHSFADNLSVRNLTRWSRVEQYTVVDPPQGTWCLANGINVSTGAACTTPNSYLPSGPRGTTRDSLNTTLYNQSDFTWTGNTFGLEHTLDVGASFLTEDFTLLSGNVERTATGAAVTLPTTSISNPNHIYTGPVNYFMTGTQDGHTETQSVYVFDNVKVLPQLSLNAGVRFDHNNGTNTSGTYTNSVFTSQGQLFRNDADMFSYRVGLVYKPVEEMSLYAAYGNSKTPSQSAVNSSCAADTCDVDPETAMNMEVGVKWNPFDDLSLAASIFRNELSNYLVPSNDPTQPSQTLDGSSRVQGVSLTATGKILPDWNVFLTYTYLDSKVLQAASNYCLAFPTDTACVAALAGTGRGGAVAGNPLTNTPMHAVNLFTTYRVLPKLTVGYGLNYQGDYYLNNASAPLYKTGEYVTQRLMASYDVFDNMSVQLNINNLFDEKYYTRIRNNGWASPGDARNATFTLNYKL